ncbi:MAG: hypothetical protein WCH39_26510, partial [Schlesneria sp.]
IKHPSERTTLLVSQLIDGQLTKEESHELNRLIQADTRNLEHVVDQMLLDSLLNDELGGESLTALVDLVADGPAVSDKAKSTKVVAGMVKWFGVTAASACSLILGTIFLWHMPGHTTASAAVTELNRIIAVTTKPGDRTYRITVEEEMSPQRRGQGTASHDQGRPPKPPMDGAVLHVRGGDQFVLVRMTQEGLPFITGCNGQASWAVRPDGPVRLSPDLARFSHDVPGHEHSMPLINIHDGLERLREAYEVQLLPVEEQEDKSGLDEEPSRLLVAVKNRSYRGPKRVEITYSVRSGLIRQMRFVEMPYGPLRLTLRMTLVGEGEQLGESFFDHESHHADDRIVEIEE